jgi:hypothetical protein
VKDALLQTRRAFIVANVMTHTGKIASIRIRDRKGRAVRQAIFGHAKRHALIKANHLLDIVKETNEFLACPCHQTPLTLLRAAKVTLGSLEQQCRAIANTTRRATAFRCVAERKLGSIVLGSCKLLSGNPRLML